MQASKATGTAISAMTEETFIGVTKMANRSTATTERIPKTNHRADFIILCLR